VDALRGFAHLFNDGNPWALAEALARLLDELTLNEFRPDEDLDSFRERLARAYGDDAPLAPMEREARLVHTLWCAYHQQLAELGQATPPASPASPTTPPQAPCGSSPTPPGKGPNDAPWPASWSAPTPTWW